MTGLKYEPDFSWLEGATAPPVNIQIDPSVRPVAAPPRIRVRLDTARLRTNLNAAMAEAYGTDGGGEPS